jgi:hypothetical protein
MDVVTVVTHIRRCGRCDRLWTGEPDDRETAPGPESFTREGIVFHIARAGRGLVEGSRTFVVRKARPRFY